MQLTEQSLLKVMPQSRVYWPGTQRTRAERFVETFNANQANFGIVTRKQIAHFLAQVAVESGEMRMVEECMLYSAPRLLQVFPKHFSTSTVRSYANKPERIGNHVYANRNGNGSESSGDGYRFRGRGYMQLSGKANYKAYEDWLNRNGMIVSLLRSPQLRAQHPGCVKSAMWFFWRLGINALADLDDGTMVDMTIGGKTLHLNATVAKITKTINGGYNGIEARQKYYDLAMKFLPEETDADADRDASDAIPAPPNKVAAEPKDDA